MPHSAPRFSRSGRSRGSYVVGGEPRLPLARRARARARSAGHRGVGHRDRAAVAGLDLATRRRTSRRGRRARPGAASAHGARVQPVRRPRRPSARARTGWNSTSSMRWPKRSCVRSTGGLPVGLAAPALIASADPASVPSACSVALGPARPLAVDRLDERGVRARRRRSPTSGGGWFVTSCVSCRGRSIVSMRSLRRQPFVGMQADPGRGFPGSGSDPSGL